MQQEHDEIQALLREIPLDERKDLYLEILASERASCEKSYYEFVKASHRAIEPNVKFEDNWHVKYLCDIVQRETERLKNKEPKTRDIIVNIIPRSLKSRIFTICWCAWAWGPFGMPHLKFINNSHNKELSTGQCLESRRLIESAWYQRFWGDRFAVTTDQNTKSWFENDSRGMRRATSTGSGIYGAGADIIVSDDPQDPEKGESEVERNTVKRHYGQTLYTRLNDQRMGLRVLVQQRLHEDDLTGHLLKNNPEQYEHICIPAELTDDVKPKALRKKYKNGLFFPSRFSAPVLRISRLPTNLGEYGYAGQCLQRPTPPGGGVFKKTWWRFWQRPGMNLTPPVFKDAAGKEHAAVMIDLPPVFDRVVDSWDTAMDGEITRDDVVGEKWSKVGASKFLLGMRIGKYSYPETKKELKELRLEHDQTSHVLVERASNGPAVKADLQNEVPGIVTIPTGKKSKEDRVKMSDTVPYQAQAEAGNIYLPHPQIDPRINGFIEEHANFPKSAQDGQVDTASQAINFLTTKKYVWPYFQPAIHVKKSGLNLDNYLHYGAVVANKASGLCVLVAVWERLNRRLKVYGELVGSGYASDTIAAKIVAGMDFGKRNVTGLFGNDLVFGEGRNLSHVINDGITSACKARGVKTAAFIQQATDLDTVGAVGLANVMLQSGEIEVNPECVDTIRQMSSWCIEKDSPEKNGFELCEALCIIISAVNRTDPIIKDIPWKDPHYKPVKTNKHSDNRKTMQAWQRG